MGYNELYHHGIKGQRWGVRRFRDNSGKLTPAGKRRIKERRESVEKEKRHIGINDKGDISLITGKTSDKGKKYFAIKSTAWIGSLAAARYISKHPELVIKGREFVIKAFGKKADVKVSDIVSDYSGIYSKALGRMLTVQEVIEAGLDL